MFKMRIPTGAPAAVLLALLLPPVGALAIEQYALDRGPAVGDPIPHSLATHDQTGAPRDFTSVVGENGLVLLFSRSLDWCIFCKGEALDWNTRIEAFTSRGYAVAILTYDSVDDLKRFAGRRDIAYNLLSDPESDVIRAFDLLNGGHRPGSRSYGIPHPAIFVIDRDGIITHRFAEAIYSRRTDISRVLRAIDAPAT